MREVKRVYRNNVNNLFVYYVLILIFVFRLMFSLVFFVFENNFLCVMFVKYLYDFQFVSFNLFYKIINVIFLIVIKDWSMLGYFLID